MIGGTMGVGKTTTCRELQKILPNNVFLDGDWCWDMQPFIVNDETKAMVMNNICFQLNQFLKCSQYENIIFCWVMHEQSIINEILSNLELGSSKVNVFSLFCNAESLEKRLEKDIYENKRTKDIIARSVPRLENYRSIHSTKIDVTYITPFQVANEIIKKFEV